MLLCMRTTIEINDELFREAKQRAANDRVPLRRIVESALRIYLEQPKQRQDYTLQWRTEKGRVQAGVRLEDRDALFDLMEGRE